MSVYYNENDRFAAAWLRELIKAKLIADGEVDERSIVEVTPQDLEGYSQCHFFAGIGGWSYALRLAGWPDGQPAYTGSCPCQPFSVAGQRQGHADQRHLWPAFYRLIAERRPSVVFGEQVASKDGREWFAAVRADLEGMGYACGGAGLPACSVGTPHVRKRIFFVASMPNTDGCRWEGQRAETVRTWNEQQFERLVQNQLQLSVPSGRLQSLVDGVSGRMGRLRGYGNAIVPQVAAKFIEAYCEINHAHTESR